VKAIGRASSWLEAVLRRIVAWERVAGIILVILLVGGSYLITGLIVAAAYDLHQYVGPVVSVLLIWTTLAVKDLAFHAKRVLWPLRAGDIARARQNLSMIVGRDTGSLNEGEVVRACVETVAENTVDGIVSPLFYAFLGGAPLAMAFKAVSTLDSMIGHKTERYLRFGWAAARLDDVANWIPARLCGVLMPLSALFCGQDLLSSWRIMRRDGAKHESPNSGIAEAAMAGALQVRLGGLSHYDSEPWEKPLIGDPNRALSLDRIPEAIHIMYTTALLTVFIGFVVSVFVPLPLINM
jgi:adenosylcobinamide-phosphate synthase